MAMGRRKDRARAPGLWIAANELPLTGGHPFYQRLNQVLDARITNTKDGRTHLAHRAEHAVDLQTGAIVGVTIQGADQVRIGSSSCVVRAKLSLHVN